MPVSLFAMIFPGSSRLRGELTIRYSISRITAGSSPLTRGTHDTLLDLANYCRFIPAYAGNSLRNMRPTIEAVGSSPLTRGTLYNDMVIADSGSVHPRLRGELFAGEQDSFSNFGSSRLRGELGMAAKIAVATAGSSRLRGELSPNI